MKPIQHVISAGFAIAALATASVPALAWTVWPDVDFEWYAQVGKPAAQVTPPAREGYIWAPAHWETHGTRQEWVAAHWVRDEALAEGAAPIAIAPTDARETVALPEPSSTGPTVPYTAATYGMDLNRR